MIVKTQKYILEMFTPNLSGYITCTRRTPLIASVLDADGGELHSLVGKFASWTKFFLVSAV